MMGSLSQDFQKRSLNYIGVSDVIFLNFYDEMFLVILKKPLAPPWSRDPGAITPTAPPLIRAWL